MLQISFDNLSKKQKILEEDTLYSLYQANQKYEELKKHIAALSEREKIELPDITLADEHNIGLLEITDLTKESLTDSLASLLTRAIVLGNQLEEDKEKRVAFEKRVTTEINHEVIDKETGIPERKERKETVLNKTARTTGKGKKWVLDIFNKEKITPKLPEVINNENKSNMDTGDSSGEITESTIGRLLIEDDPNNNALEKEDNASQDDIKIVLEPKDTRAITSAATNGPEATQTGNREKVSKNEREDTVTLTENRAEPIVEDMFVRSIRDSLRGLKTALENSNLTTTERELILYKIDKFNSLSIESQTLVAKQSEHYNTTYTEKEADIEKKLKEKLSKMLETHSDEKAEREKITNEKYIEIEKNEKSEYLSSNPEKEAQIISEEQYDQKVREAKEAKDRQNQIRTNAFFSDIKNSVKERKKTELENIHSHYENLVSEKSIGLRNKYEAKFNADMDKLNLDMLTEKKEFLITELKGIEDTVLTNLSNWHELATKELNDKHTNLILEKEKIELEIERSQSVLRNQKEKEGYQLEIVKLKKEIEEKSLKEARYVANEETRLQQNQVSLDLQNKMIEELENKKSFMYEVEVKVEERINKSLHEEKTKNEKLKYVLYSTIGLAIVSLGLAVYGLSDRGSAALSLPVQDQSVGEIEVLSTVEEDTENDDDVNKVEELSKE
ncbi:hypothetical protein [Alkalibacterium sp. 20]|uniref:hypothetical protein n=1 Tax=Alkalibacterium sp. 20 TaxID=1798803 RepID=UPI0009001F25|nr:hypothetical protein [Alkalibacterium sp. 20]OJF96186.1 hypothetical protein AX762_05485 [Alkalibacterium sp. 20]